MNDSPSYAQIDRLREWFSLPYKVVEKLTFLQARTLIGEVYQSNMSPETMAAFRQRVIETVSGQLDPAVAA